MCFLFEKTSLDFLLLTNKISLNPTMGFPTLLVRDSGDHYFLEQDECVIHRHGKNTKLEL